MVKEKFPSSENKGNIIFVDGKSDVEVIFRLIKLLKTQNFLFCNFLDKENLYIEANKNFKQSIS